MSDAAQRLAASFPVRDPSRGRAFDDDDVARAYAFRPGYPRELYAHLLTLVPRGGLALDLGCGDGKIARDLAASFQRIDAVDPAAAMLAAARRLSGAQRNVRWIEGMAESAPFEGAYDLITAGASIHWMRPDILFPRLANAISAGGAMAIIGGDEAHAPPWEDRFIAFVSDWVARLGGRFDPSEHFRSIGAYEPWFEVHGERHFTHRVTQSVGDFIECQHSRGTWARWKMGVERAAAFDAELAELLAPHADNGVLRFDVQAQLRWGRPRVAAG